MVARKQKTSTKRVSKIETASKKLRRRLIVGSTFFVFMLFLATNISIATSLDITPSFWGKILGDNDRTEEVRGEEPTDENKDEDRDKIEVENEDKHKEEDQEDSQEEEERFTPQTIQTQEAKDEDRDEIEVENEDEISQETRQRNETEIRTDDGQVIKTKIEDDGTTKIEIEGQDYKFKYVLRGGKVKVRAENESGEEVAVPEEVSQELEDSLQDELEIEGIEVDTSLDTPGIIKNGFKTFTSFPLSIDPLTRSLIVTTPTGQKIVSVLPDKAIENLLLSGVITTVESQDNTVDQEIVGVSEIIERDNELVYKVKGTRRHRVLGFIPLDLPVIAYLSTENGEPLEKEQSIFASIVEAISD